MTSTEGTDARTLRAELADHLAADVLTWPRWVAAFRAVPRHVFAPRFAIHDPVAGGFVHHDVADPDPGRRAAALTAVYSDDTLITRFDDSGTPISSSTEPTLMAAMLQALDAREGHRVLEIGTGTGYNAALLCEALGDHIVTTIDVDPDLVATARAALTRSGYAPVVVSGDGTGGVPDRAPFDRIIATCGADRVPVAWLEQLQPSGAILVNISKGIVLLRRDGNILSGRFLSPAGFMPLRSHDDPVRCTGHQVLQATSGDAETVHTVTVPGELPFTTAAFLVNLVADHSELVVVHASEDTDVVASYRWLHPASGSWARAERDGDHTIVHQAGPRRLWTELTPVLDSWLAAGRPGIDRYGLTITAQGQHTLWLDQPGNVVAALS